MGKDTGGNRKQGRSGAGAGAGAAPQQAAPQQAAPQQAAPQQAAPQQAAPQQVSPAFAKAKAAEENGVKLRGGAESLTAGQQVYVKKRPNNVPAGPDPWRLRDKTTGQIVAVAKNSQNLLAFANAMALTVVPEK